MLMWTKIASTEAFTATPLSPFHKHCPVFPKTTSVTPTTVKLLVVKEKIGFSESCSVSSYISTCLDNRYSCGLRCTTSMKCVEIEGTNVFPIWTFWHDDPVYLRSKSGQSICPGMIAIVICSCKSRSTSLGSCHFDVSYLVRESTQIWQIKGILKEASYMFFYSHNLVPCSHQQCYVRAHFFYCLCDLAFCSEECNICIR